MAPVPDRYLRTYPPGHILFREGDRGQEMYVLRSGTVQLTRHCRGEERIVCVLSPGECLGEMALLLGRPRSATAVVLTEASLLAIDAGTFEELIGQNAEIAIRLLRTMARRLHMASEQIETLLLPDLDHRVVHEIRSLSEHAGEARAEGLYIPLSRVALADRVGIGVDELDSVLEQLIAARIVAQEPDGGLLVSEAGRLDEFLEYLEMRQSTEDETRRS